METKNTENKIAGIDPGIYGAITVLSGINVEIYDMPIESYVQNKKNRNRISSINLYKLLNSLSIDFCIIENVSAHPGNGTKSAFSFGYGYGCLLSCINILDIKHELVAPLKWKKHFSVTSDKQTSIDKACELFPDLKEKYFKYKSSDGRAESALMALYGRDFLKQ